MTNEVGIDDAMHYHDMAGSIGTCTTQQSTSYESQSEKENSESERHDDGERASTVRLESKDVKDQYNVVKLDEDTTTAECQESTKRTSAVQLKLKNDDDRFNIFTLNREIEDEDSSFFSEDFEDNDFDALVGEFFWYLREKESSKMTPRSRSRSSMSTPDRTPRAMGGDRILSLRNIEKKGRFEVDKNADTNSHSLQIDDRYRKESTPERRILTPRNGDETGVDFEASKTPDRTSRSVQFDEMEGVDHHKENLTRSVSVIVGDIEADEEAEAIPVPPIHVANLFHESDEVLLNNTEMKAQDPSHAALKTPTAAESGVIQESQLPQTKASKENHENTAPKSEHQMTPSRSEIDYKAYVVWARRGLMKQTPTPIKIASSSVHDLEEKRGSPKENNQESPPPSKVLSESREDNNTESAHQMSPSRDDADYKALGIWARRGLMKQTPTPQKVASCRIDENEDDGGALNETTDCDKTSSSMASSLPFSSPSQKVVTWPPARNIASPPKEEESTTAANSEGEFENEDQESSDDASLGFDADQELSRILDKFDSNQSDEEDERNADIELSRILDDSPGVNTIMSLTRKFMERQYSILNSIDADEKSAQSETSTVRSLVHIAGDNKSLLPIFTGSDESNDLVSNTTQQKADAKKEPESSFTMISSKSVVAETSSFKLSAPSPRSIRGREMPSDFIVCENVPPSSRYGDPDGYLMDDESSCLTSPSLSPASANTGGTKVRFQEKLPEYQKETQMAQKFPNIGTFSPLSADLELIGGDFGSPSSTSLSVKERNDLPVSTQPTQTTESSTVFDSPSQEKQPPRQPGSNCDSPSDESVSSRKTYGSFAALSVSAIEKKSSSPPNLSESTLTLDTSIVFDSPISNQIEAGLNEKRSIFKFDGTSSGTKPPLRQSKSPVETNTDKDRPERKHSDPMLLNRSMSCESQASSSESESSVETRLLPDDAEEVRTSAAVVRPVLSITWTQTESDPILLNRSGSLSESSSVSSREPDAPSATTASIKVIDINDQKDSPTVNVPIHTQTTIVLDSSVDTGSSASTSAVSSADFDEQKDGSLCEVHVLSATHTKTETPQPATTIHRSGANESAHDEGEDAQLPYPMPQSIQFVDAQSVQESFEGPSSLAYSLSLTSKEPSLSTAASTSPLKALALVKSEDTLAASPPSASARKPDNIVEKTNPEPTVSRKPSSKFSNILNQWKEMSEHNPNGHFLSPPGHGDTVPFHSQMPPATTHTPIRRRSTGEFVENPKEETSLPRWTPQAPHSSVRRRSIGISTITIPNRNVPSSRKPTSTKTLSYWNGMIESENTSRDNKWTSRSVTRRESSDPGNLMLTVPKQDAVPSLSTSFSRDTIATSTTCDDDEVPCNCTESAFSGNDQLMEFFLPKLGMAHTCGKRNPPILIDSDPIGLHHILRPWQVEFLRSCDIYRGDQLVKACKNRAGSLAGAMRKWRLEHDMTCPRSAACGMALHIWSRTCKYYVRTIRRQMAEGLVEVEPPTLGDVMYTVESKEPSFASTDEDDSRA